MRKKSSTGVKIKIRKLEIEAKKWRRTLTGKWKIKKVVSRPSKKYFTLAEIENGPCKLAGSIGISKRITSSSNGS